MRPLTQHEKSRLRAEIFCRILCLAELSYKGISDDEFFEGIILQIREERAEFLRQKEVEKRKRLTSGEGLFND